MRNLILRTLCLALIFTACGCCCHGSHRMWPFCGTKRCFGGGSYPGYIGPSTAPCNPCPTGACPPSGGGAVPYYPSGSYQSYDTISPVSGPVASPTYYPASAMAPIESLPTY
ncbi:MAG: hypothetical protein WD066_18200 [Planctomycetaceae bacterium]